ncbi:MoxR family ATPase [Thermoleophilia bacterium SCSIO 60948]|nr:MoxR family ATPase [Thermoleophilia bacterium SCSIO 60948]
MATESTDMAQAGGVPPSDFSSDPSRVAEIAADELILPNDLSQLAMDATEDLVLDPRVVEQAVSALVAGHVVLQGPPGTGKTELAKRLAGAFQAKLAISTAHEDWTTYDVIGRQELRADENGNEVVVPVDGHVTRAILECAGQMIKREDADDDATEQAVWLVVDELNRSHFDRAFGELFTALGSDDLVGVGLTYRPGIELVVPRRFRIIATINSVDRQFVHNLSQALRRRFSFVTLDVPGPPPADAEWSRTADSSSPLAIQEFTLVLKKALGLAKSRLSGHEDELDEVLHATEGSLIELFQIVHRLRSGGETTKSAPYLPVGTATMIDLIETFLIDAVVNDRTDEELDFALDSSAALRVAPLLEADVLEPDQLEAFADALTPPFDGAFARALRRTAAVGLHGI